MSRHFRGQHYNRRHPHHEQRPPIVVHEHDVLSGRGVNIAHHPGNERFRALVTSRADDSYCTAYSASEKRAVAQEIIRHIKALDPPGRFLKRDGRGQVSRGLNGPWEELSNREAIKKTCQALRDCNRSDRSGYAVGVKAPSDVLESAEQRHRSGLTRKQQAEAAAAAETQRTGRLSPSIENAADLLNKQRATISNSNSSTTNGIVSSATSHRVAQDPPPPTGTVPVQGTPLAANGPILPVAANAPTPIAPAGAAPIAPAPTSITVALSPVAAPQYRLPHQQLDSQGPLAAANPLADNLMAAVAAGAAATEAPGPAPYAAPAPLDVLAYSPPPAPPAPTPAHEMATYAPQYAPAPHSYAAPAPHSYAAPAPAPVYTKFVEIAPPAPAPAPATYTTPTPLPQEVTPSPTSVHPHHHHHHHHHHHGAYGADIAVGPHGPPFAPDLQGPPYATPGDMASGSTPPPTSPFVSGPPAPAATTPAADSSATPSTPGYQDLSGAASIFNSLGAAAPATDPFHAATNGSASITPAPAPTPDPLTPPPANTHLLDSMLQATPAATRDAQELIEAMSGMSGAVITNVAAASTASSADLNGYHDPGLEHGGATLEDAAALGMTEL